MSCPKMTAGSALFGPSRVWMQSSVFEAGSGRTSVVTRSIPVHPERFYIGLRTKTKHVKANKPFKVQGVLVDWKKKPYLKTKQIELTYGRIYEEYGWYQN